MIKKFCHLISNYRSYRHDLVDLVSNIRSSDILYQVTGTLVL